MHAQGKAPTAQQPESVTAAVDPISVIYGTTLATSVCRTCVGPEQASELRFIRVGRDKLGVRCDFTPRESGYQTSVLLHCVFISAI